MTDDLADIRAAGAQLAGSSTAAPELPAGDRAPPPQSDVVTAAEAFKREAEEWAGLPYVFGSILAEAMPELERVYTDEACLAWGEKMVPVARHHGWTIGVAGMWLALIGASWGLLKPTGAAIRRRVKEKPKPAPAGTVDGARAAAAATGAAGGTVPGNAAPSAPG